MVFAVTLPSLKELIVQEDESSFDSQRWFLLQWLLGVDEEKISKIRTSTDSKFIRVVSLTLEFLLSVRKKYLHKKHKLFETNQFGHFYIFLTAPNHLKSWINSFFEFRKTTWNKSRCSCAAIGSTAATDAENALSRARGSWMDSAGAYLYDWIWARLPLPWNVWIATRNGKKKKCLARIQSGINANISKICFRLLFVLKHTTFMRVCTRLASKMHDTLRVECNAFVCEWILNKETNIDCQKKLSNRFSIFYFQNQNDLL